MYLLICRHAKSDWGNPELNDFERPLNKRGLKSSSAMGVFLNEKELPVHHILSSSAKRAYTTACRIAKELAYPEEQIVTDNGLYLADVEVILKSIEHHASAGSNVLVFGHNPGFTELVNFFGVRLDNLPTAGMIAFEFADGEWKDLHKMEPQYKWHQFPRNL